jgi:serine/threonine-protein kinase
MRSGQQRVLLEGGSCARYAPTGHLIYARAGSLFAVRFDPNRLQVDGSPVPVVEGVSWQGGLGFADYSFSNSGTLVYVPSGGAEENRTMVWVDREGKSEPLPAAPRAYSNPHLSPDGKRIAVAILGREQNISDIWIYDLPRGILARLTSGYLDFAPVWTPDGARVTFRSSTSSRHSGIFWVPADSSAPPQQLVTTNEPATPGAWSPEGSALVFAQGLPAKTGIWMLQRSGDGGQWKAAPLFAANAFLPQLSPDGRWIAYVSGDSGNLQVYLQPFPGPGGKLQVSTDGGTSPRWARSARELFYRNGDKMMAIDIDTRQGLTAGRPRLLFEGQYEMSPPNMQPGTGYDVSADGKRFLMVKRGGQSSIAQFAVVQDWFEELKRLRTDK